MEDDGEQVPTQRLWSVLSRSLSSPLFLPLTSPGKVNPHRSCWGHIVGSFTRSVVPRDKQKLMETHGRSARQRSCPPDENSGAESGEAT